ncbi:MAG TPA: methyltransferase domain-containing protein [Chloroflexota bacterium]|nr:methyltransferase domain-containing protein [Chloroflexota bacterium]
MPWDPDRYHQFQRERALPFEDLLELVHVRPDLDVIDLGCGTGELTARLARALPRSHVVGLDSSPQMLQRAQAVEHPHLHFRQGDLADLTGTWDLIVSNAAIQWVDDHRALLPRLFGALRPNGQIAVQIPSNYGHISHRLILDVASQEPFQTALCGWVTHRSVLTIEEYAGIFYDLGAAEITVFEKVYPHVLPDADAVADWTRGTALVPYMERLPEDLQGPFLDRYRDALRAALPTRPVFYPFRRTLFSAIKPAQP